MIPAFRPDDHVLTLNWTQPKVSDVVVFKDNDRYFLKRIIKIKKNLFYVSGDNKKESLVLGPMVKKQVVGKVILKY